MFIKRIVYLGVTETDKDFTIKKQYIINVSKDDKVFEDLRVFFVKCKKFFIGTSYLRVNTFENDIFYLKSSKIVSNKRIRSFLYSYCAFIHMSRINCSVLM